MKRVSAGHAAERCADRVTLEQDKVLNTCVSTALWTLRHQPHLHQ